LVGCRSVRAVGDGGAEVEGLPELPARLGHPLLVCSPGGHVRSAPHCPSLEKAAKENAAVLNARTTDKHQLTEGITCMNAIFACCGYTGPSASCVNPTTAPKLELGSTAWEAGHLVCWTDTL